MGSHVLLEVQALRPVERHRHAAHLPAAAHRMID
jgi:hypothetical protein